MWSHWNNLLLWYRWSTTCIKVVLRVLMVWCFSSQNVNSLWPCDIISCHRSCSTLVQVMTYHLFGAKPLSEPMWTYCQFDPWNKLQWNLQWNSNFFTEENTFENVVSNMLASLFTPQCNNVWLTLDPPPDCPLQKRLTIYSYDAWIFLEYHSWSLEPSWPVRGKYKRKF